MDALEKTWREPSPHRELLVKSRCLNIDPVWVPLNHDGVLTRGGLNPSTVNFL
jgi:hypothetical protein